MHEREIKKVDFLGEPVNRRDAMIRLGTSLAALKAASLFGADPFSVGAKGKGVGEHDFGALGGFVDNGTLYLPSGVSLQVGQYGNPIMAPGIFHGATLENLDPAIVDQTDLRKSVGIKEDVSVSKALSGMRIYKALVKAKGQQGYTEYDLSKRWNSPPKIEVASNGSLSITQSGETLISKEDGFYLQLAYHPDRNRLDTGGFIGVFEEGPAPSFMKPIGFAELDIPALAIDSTREGWNGVQESKAQLLDVVSSSAEVTQGTQFIRVGPNVWRYAYEERADSAVVLQVECKRHGDRPNTDWDKMGELIYYKLATDTNGTAIAPEPDLGKVMNMHDFLALGEDLYITGVVLYSNRDGQIHTERTSLSKLQNVDGGKVRIEGNQMVHEVNGEVNRYQIIEMRKKPGFAQNTVDLYAVKANDVGLKFLPTQPVVTTIGSFDLVKAYRDSKKTLPRILT